MAQSVCFKTENRLIIEGRYHNTLDIEGFSQMMKDPSFCYKFYWLEAIVQLYLRRNSGITTFDEIIDEMICNAWYSVREFHIHLSGLSADGQVRDGLERAVLQLTELSGLPSDASENRKSGMRLQNTIVIWPDTRNKFDQYGSRTCSGWIFYRKVMRKCPGEV